jgi:hypothetical protein
MHKMYIAGEFWLRRRGEIPLLSQIKICNSILEALWHWLCYGTKSLGREVRISIILRIAIDIRSGHWIWALDPHSHRHCSKCGTHLARKAPYERPKNRSNSGAERGMDSAVVYSSPQLATERNGLGTRLLLSRSFGRYELVQYLHTRTIAVGCMAASLRSHQVQGIIALCCLFVVYNTTTRSARRLQTKPFGALQNGSLRSQISQDIPIVC